MDSKLFSFSQLPDKRPCKDDLDKRASDPLLANTFQETEEESEIIALLAFSRKWYVHSEGRGCSCHFRHAIESYDPKTGEQFPPEFGGPEEWCEEVADSLDATRSIYDIINRLILEGYSLDLVDHWGAEPDDIETVQVSSSQVPRDHFRFFGDYKFTFSA